MTINDSESPGTITFPASVWSLYSAGGPVTRLQLKKSAFVQVTNLTGSSDTFLADGGEIDLWWFPVGAAPLASVASIGFNPSSVGAVQTAVRYSYLCNATTFASNLDQQAPHIVIGSGGSIPLFKTAGIPICYDYLYMDAANNPIGARSSVQVLP